MLPVWFATSSETEDTKAPPRRYTTPEMRWQLQCSIAALGVLCIVRTRHFILWNSSYPVRGRVMRLVASVCVRRSICLLVLASALLLGNLLSVICCLLFEFKRLQCGLIQTEQFMPFQIRSYPWSRNIFFWALTTHHTLWARLFRFLCYNSFDTMHVCRLARAVQNASNYSQFNTPKCKQMIISRKYARCFCIVSWSIIREYFWE